MSSDIKARTRLSLLSGHLVQQHPQRVAQTVPIYTANTDATQFRFSTEHGPLTLDQRRFYEENGYILFKGLIPQADLDTYREHFRKLCMDEVPRVPTMTVMRDVSLKKQKGISGELLITKIQDFQDDPVLFEYCKHPALLDIVQSFTGPNIKSIHSMLIHKPPGVGESGRHPFHQDLYYFPMRPADQIVASWTAMERVDRQNGCLSVIPGSHKGQLMRHGYPQWGGMVNKAYHGILDFQPPDDRVHLIMEAGDTVFFHPLLIHGSGANRTQGFRKAISCHYASADCHWIDVKGTIQEEIAHEIEDMAAMRTKMTVDFLDVWRFKSRLVRGKETNLV